MLNACASTQKTCSLATPMDHFEYMSMPIHLIPKELTIAYNFQHKQQMGTCMCKYRMECITYHRLAFLPISSYFNACLLIDTLNFIPVLYHIQTTLVVDNFGIKYTDKKHSQHSFNSFKHKERLDRQLLLWHFSWLELWWQLISQHLHAT